MGNPSMEKYFELYQLAPVAFLSVSESGIIIEANQTAENLLGCESSALINCSIVHFLHRMDYDQFRTHCKLLFETGSKQTFELRFMKSNEEVIWVQVVATLMGSDQAPVGWFAINEITKRKDDENEMIQSEQMVEATTLKKIQLDELQSHLNPHFMFNALSAVIAMCYTDVEMAAELLTKFSRYLRLTLSAGDYEAGVTVQKTLELIEMYTEIEKSRFGDRLKVIVDVDPSLLEAIIIPLVVQPLVENALHHGILQKIDGGTVHLKIKPMNNFVKITVVDNGVGMSKELINSLLQVENSPVGIGISSIDQRVFFETGQHLKIRSIEGVGTVVRVLLPLEIKRNDR